MKKIAFVVMILMTFGYGCVKDTNLVVEELNKKRDNSTLEQLVETPIEIDVYKEGWTDEQRGFWASNYWAMLAGNPQTRARFEPLSVYKIATCIVDTWAKDKTLKEFNTEVATSNDPMIARLMYNITYECTTFEVLRLRSTVPQEKEELTLKNTL